MLVAYCFVALTAGLVSLIGLWPALGPMSLFAAPFAASAAALGMGGILASRTELRSEETLATPEEQAEALRSLAEAGRKAERRDRRKRDDAA
jgi:hypothetical protein